MKENKEDYHLEYEYIFLMTYTDLITKNDPELNKLTFLLKNFKTR